MAIQQPRTRPSIYLTFKVLQFVNQLRRRLKPRLQGTSYPSLLGTEICLGLESQALRSFAKGVSRIGLQDRKQFNHASDRVCKSRKNKNIRPTLKLQTPGQEDAAIQNISGGEVQHMLNSVDEKLSPPGSALSAIASNDRLFLKQNTAMNFDACSLNETIQLLVVVHDAINVLYGCRSWYDDGWLIAQAREAGLSIDEAFIANYEHLLMRLRTQLIDALSRKVVEALLLGEHDKKQRRLLGWFTEFSGEPRPLSGSFPWTIKPSLAVLWGVCWMYYNPPGRRVVQEGNLRVPQATLLQNVELPRWNTPGSTDYFDFGLQLTGTQPQPAAQEQPSGDSGSVGLSGVGLRLRNQNGADTWDPANLELGCGPSVSRASVARSNRLGSGLSTYSLQSFEGFCPNNRDLNNSLPGNPGSATLSVYPQQRLDLPNFNPPWHQLPTSLPQRTARHLTSLPHLPVSGSADNEGYPAPHPDFVSYGNIFPAPQQEPQAPTLNVITDFPDFGTSPYTMGNCPPPETSSMHTHQGPRHERTSSVNSNSNIPTPVSMSGPRSPFLSPVVGGRRHSLSSSQEPMRQPSEEHSSQDEDALSPRKNHAFKRAEEPPRNHDNKMVCKHKECEGLTFDRKCEWSKHMDKHDRPYKCNVKGCEKLQGFTYSGGLLRHEREVHKMHGGTKKSLFCPFADCKRSSGSGFTRKENLAEHIRRVHRRTSMSADLGHLIIPRSHTQDEPSTAEVRLPSDSPYQHMVDTVPEDEGQLSLKRKRVPETRISEEREDTDLRAEIKRLRQENEEKDTRLRQLEQAVMALQQQGRR